MNDCFALPTVRYRLDQKPDTDGPGIYFVFLNSKVSLDPFSLRPERLIYIGKSESTIEARNHANYRSSSSSSLRRSLGAILREKHLPDNYVFPRNSNGIQSEDALKKSIQHYRFSEKSESWLSFWMLDNLSYGYEIISAGVNEIRARERQHIQRWNPILNLTFCRHQQKGPLETLRKQCRDGARARNENNE
jgi:hypothetical protein